jgi:hypothetical protein
MVYPSLSYALFTVIGIVALSMLIIWINSYSEDVQGSYANEQLNYAADVMRNNVLDMYSLNANSVVLVPIPRYIVGRQYSISLDNSSVTLRLDVGKRVIEVKREIGVNATLSGRSYAPATLQMSKEDKTIMLV